MRPVSVTPIYPKEPRDLPEYYATFINVHGSPEEVLLDLCTIQPQEMHASPESPVGSLPALVRARVIISKAHAARLVTILSEILQAERDNERH